MSSLKMRPSRPGVTSARTAVVLYLLATVALFLVAVETWRRDFPIGFPLVAAGGALAGLGVAWTYVHAARARALGSIPRTRDGVLLLRIPESMRPAWILSLVGGWFFSVAATLVIAAVITDTPRLSAGVRAMGVAVLVIVWAAFVAWIILATLLLPARFEADVVGIRWDSPVWLSSGELSWDEVAAFRFKKSRITGWSLIVTTRDGRSRRIEFAEPPVPLSYGGDRVLTAALETLRSQAI